MQTKSLLLGLLSLPLSLSLVACDDDAAPSPSTVRAQIAKDVPHILGNSQQAVEASNAAIPMIPAQVDTMLRLASFKYPNLAPAIDKLPKGKLAPNDPVDGGGEFDPDAAAQWLNENIFTDANHLGGGVFAVPASLACTTVSYDETTGTEIESLDPECTADWQTAQIRIRVAQNDGTLRFALQVDANHDEPLEITLAHTRVGLTVDLDESNDAMIALATAFGEEAPNAELAGQITGSLEVPSTSHVVASLTIDRAISIKVAENGQALDGDGAMRFTSAAATVFAIDLDGGTETGAIDLGLGATTVHMPGVADPDFPQPSVDVDLGGVTANATFAAGQPLVVANIGLGGRAATVEENGALVSSIELDTFTATLTGDANGSQLAVSPKLDLRMVDNSPDSFERYQVTRVLFDGASPTLAASATSAQLRIVSGNLAMETNPAEYGMSVGAGQCFAETEMIDDVTSEYYMQWVAQTCE